MQAQCYFHVHACAHPAPRRWETEGLQDSTQMGRKYTEEHFNHQLLLCVRLFFWDRWKTYMSVPRYLHRGLISIPKKLSKPEDTGTIPDHPTTDIEVFHLSQQSTWTDITSFKFLFSSFLNKVQDSALIFFRLHSLTKYLAKSLIHNSAASTFPYIDFPIQMQYSSRKVLVMITKSKMPSGHSMYILTYILGHRNGDFASHCFAIHPSSS